MVCIYSLVRRRGVVVILDSLLEEGYFLVLN